VEQFNRTLHPYACFQCRKSFKRARRVEPVLPCPECGGPSKRLYRERNLIERFFSKLKHFRRVATRYDKLAENFLAMVQLASMRLWLRAYESTA
jgi:transposase